MSGHTWYPPNLFVPEYALASFMDSGEIGSDLMEGLDLDSHDMIGTSAEFEEDPETMMMADMFSTMEEVSNPILNACD